jgi:mersacidin/lichenicidin family type 2 lantibiotic
MSVSDVIRAWRDPEFRDGLGTAERAALPAHPSGLIDLSDFDLDAAIGGNAAKSPAVVCNKSKPLSTCDCIAWG